MEMDMFFESRKKDIIAFYCVFLGISALFMLFCSCYALFNSQFSVFVNSTTEERNHKVIIIDAGHGGIDIGGSSKSGILEKDINLKIAKRLNTLLSLSDLNIVMTRKEDVLLYKEGEENRKKYYDLLNRAKIAEDTDNSIFISIHQNIFNGAVCSGFQVYYSRNNPESAVLAKCLQNTIVAEIQNDNKRQVKPAGSEIFVLHNIQKPAVLAECGFLSNQDEARLLADEAYQKAIASGIFKGVLSYFAESTAG